ncbi:uncharacterized protein EDB91DRAFT_1081629 [Suillus paluster]|uniref:uncharacterized protein n=1 Tax=Suillus paluster TaxID=48578 RepID=UPI001B86E52E|nr:uncharacterized protein EDB91DRAFT_1081629 [Suillus paluster]KAG1741832.1 hypothetical protein EDB91DRAFT_1081629 [Suillus paluster]
MSDPLQIQGIEFGEYVLQEFKCNAEVCKGHVWTGPCRDRKEWDVSGAVGNGGLGAAAGRRKLKKSFGTLIVAVQDEILDAKDDESDEGSEKHNYYFELQKPPTVKEACKALDDLQQLLKPPQKDQTGYKDPKLPPVLKERLSHMKSFLWLYVDVRKDGRSHSANPVRDSGNMLLIELHEMHKEKRVPREITCLTIFSTGPRHILVTEKHCQSVTHLVNSCKLIMRF